MFDLKALREEYATLHTASNASLEKISQEKEGKFSAEDRQAQDARYARMDLIKAQVDEQERFSKMVLSAEATAQTVVQVPTDPKGKAEYEAALRGAGLDNGAGQFDAAKFAKRVSLYAQTGDTRHLFATDTGTDSGAYLPKQVGLPISVRRLKNAFRGALEAFNYKPIEIATSTNFSLPIGDDTANTGQAQTEAATSGTILDESQAGLSMAPTLYSSKQKWFSNTMILANVFNVMDYVVPMLQMRLEKVQESAWTTTLKTKTVGKTLATTTGITYAELLAWEHSLAAAYRSDAAFMVADTLYQSLRGLVDSQNRPIMDLDPTNVFQGKIHGKPVLINDYLDAIAANKIVGAFLSADAIKIVDAANQRVVVYKNVPQYPDQTGFEVFQNGDCKFVTAGVSLVKTAIS